VDHGFERSKAVAATAVGIFILGLPSALIWIKMDSEGVRFPEFLEVQDHIWGYGLMFSGLFIAFTIWRYGWSRWRESVAAGEAENDLRGYIKHGVPAFRDDFINTGDNDIWVGRWWDVIMYLGFPFMFSVLMLSYFADMLTSVEDPWNPMNPHGIGIILVFWGTVGGLFLLLNRKLVSYSLWRNVPEGADVDISTLPGGEDENVYDLGEEVIVDAEILT